MGAGGGHDAAGAAPWPLGSASRALAAQLAPLGLRAARRRPIAVGVIGVDDSLSFAPPRRRGAARRSAPPAGRRAAGAWGGAEAAAEAGGAAGSSAGAPGGVTAASEELLRLLEAGGGRQQEEAQLQAFGCGGCPRVALAFIARLLCATDSPQAALHLGAVPALRRLLAEAPPAAAMRALAAWARALRGARPAGAAEAAGAPGGEGGTALRCCGFGSAAAVRDAATVLLAIVARVRPPLLERCCPAATVAAVAEGLRSQMLSPGSGVRLQGLACELLAMDFPFWWRHLPPRRPVLTAGAAPAALGAAPTPGRGAAGAAAATAATAAAAAAPRAPSPEVSPRTAASADGSSSALQGADEELEVLAAQLLAIYQDPRLSQPSLGLLLQVGAMEPSALLRAMGRAARQLERSAGYRASALLVLVAFVRGAAAKVLPLLPGFTEAVLRCLEPSDPSLRRQSLLAVTSALHELVQTFPMVAFHQTTQKFAVGTADGLVVVYDLRTATKWRILEGHSGAVAALAFSQEGERLGSYSSRDNGVRVWSCSPGGFFGGLLGNSGRCLRQHTLPACPPEPAGTRLATAPGAAGAGESPSLGRGWRAVALVWTEQGLLRLVRENGQVVQLRPD